MLGYAKEEARQISDSPEPWQEHILIEKSFFPQEWEVQIPRNTKNIMRAFNCLGGGERGGTGGGEGGETYFSPLATRNTFFALIWQSTSIGPQVFFLRGNAWCLTSAGDK